MREEPPPPEQPQARRRRWVPRFRRRATGAAPGTQLARAVPLGRLVLGLVLVGIGVVWLLEALDVVNVSFLAVLPAALIVIGVALVVAARTGRHGGLIALGVIITVILTIASSFDIRLRGGVGDRNERPTTAADIQREYHLSLGQLTIDLRAVSLSESAGPRTIKASVGMGQLTVRIPSGALVEATGHVGAGQVTIFGRENSGLDVKLVGHAPPPPGFQVIGGTAQLILDLSVGLGQIEVTR